MEPSMLASVDKDCFLFVEKDETVAPANDSLGSFLVTQSVRVILWLKLRGKNNESRNNRFVEKINDFGAL